MSRQFHLDTGNICQRRLITLTSFGKRLKSYLGNHGDKEGWPRGHVQSLPLNTSVRRSVSLTPKAVDVEVTGMAWAFRHVHVSFKFNRLGVIDQVTRT